MAVFIGVFGRCDHLAWVEQLQVESACNVGVKKPGFAFPHGVLVQAEAGQPVPDEISQCLQGLRAFNRPPELIDRSGMVCEAPVHQRNDLQGDGIGCEAAWRRYDPWPVFAKAGSVLGVKVPLPADRQLAVHENARFFAHLPVEKLHPQLLAALGVCRKVPHGTEKMRIVANFEHKRVLAGDVAQRIQHTPLAGRCHDQLVRSGAHNGLLQFAGQRSGVVRCVELGVHQRYAALIQACRKVAHGT